MRTWHWAASPGCIALYGVLIQVIDRQLVQVHSLDSDMHIFNAQSTLHIVAKLLLIYACVNREGP